MVDDGKVDVRFRNFVQVIRKRGESGVGDDLHEVTVREASFPSALEIAVIDSAAPVDDGARESQRRADFGIFRATLPRFSRGSVREACAFAERRVRGEAIIAAIELGRGQRDRLARPRIQVSLGGGAEERNEAFQHGG